jgi:hypothetical protein
MLGANQGNKMKTVWILRQDLMHICGVYLNEAKADRAMRELEAKDAEGGDPYAHTYYVTEEDVE